MELTMQARAHRGWETRRVNAHKKMQQELRAEVFLHLFVTITVVLFLYLALDGYLKAKLALDAFYSQSYTTEAHSKEIEGFGSPVEAAMAASLTFETAMHKEIHDAAIEFNVPESLILGIAKAESSMGTHYAHDYDYNCHNWWGIRKVRDDGSYLRCFNDDRAGARTAASLLSRRYVSQGLNTPEEICPVWIGPAFAKQNCPHWIENVKSVN